MGALFLEILPAMLGLALTPTAIALGILFLSSKRPVANAVAFAAPFAIVYSLLSIVLLAASAASDEPLVDPTTKYAIGLAIGLLLLAIGALQYIRGRHPVREARKAGLLDKVEDARPRLALLLGFVVAVLNPNIAILIVGLANVAAAEVSGADRALGALLLVLSAEAGLIVPILWYVLRPKQAKPGLAKLRAWLSKHERTIDIGVLLVFGTLFTLRGLGGLIE